MMIKNVFILLLILLVSCDKGSEVIIDPPFPIKDNFKLIVKNTTIEPVKVLIKNYEYRPVTESNSEMEIWFGLNDWAADDADVEGETIKQLSIRFLSRMYGDDMTMWERTGLISSFMIEFEFESGEKISYWGLPQECDVIGYGADYYGIAYVSKDTGGLYTIYDEDNRFTDFALTAIINSEDDIEISVDYENSVIIESNE